MSTSAEQQRLHAGRNSANREHLQDYWLPQLIEAQARKAPGAIAVAYNDRQLSYEELNTRANAVARRLRRLGVGPDVLVGLCLDRSLELFIAILAILKAGGAYVPLDAANPEERLRTILSEVQPRVVLTDRRLSLCFSERYPMVVLDEQVNAAKDEDPSELSVAATPDNLAYVIFTSGSTGIPKGVLVPHRALVNHSTAMASYFELRADDRVLQFAPYSFDVAAEEIFPTWLCGGTVVAWPATPGLTAVSTFAGFVANEEITILNLPAPFWEEWVSDLDRVGIPPSVRLIVVGSEKVSSEKFVNCRKQIPKYVRLCNAYGLTETTITATTYEPGAEYPYSDADCAPIGRPIANTQAYVLDENLALMPVGVAGELYIAGNCLARGYLNRPELTAERFIPSPYSRDSGARMYKTGDLARYLPDGNIEYLGRIDNQVKLRGFRIELGEIETALHRSPGVERAAVLLREDNPGDKRLVAYVVCKARADTTAEHLRMMLRQTLPHYMVPSAIILLESFPLMASGKIDRRSLPRPESDRSQSADSYVACRTPAERQLAQIWEDILSVKPIGITDNFFDLGGNSLLGVRMMVQVEKTFGKSFPLFVLYEAPTVGLMSKLIIEDSETRRWSTLIPLQPNGSRPPFFWMHGETSNAFLPHYLDPDQPVYALRDQGWDGRRARYRTVKQIAAYYLKEIRSVRPQGPYFLGGYCFGAVVAYEVAQILRKNGEIVPLLVLLSPDRPEHVPAISCSKAPYPETGCPYPNGPKRSWAAELRRRIGAFAEADVRQQAHLFLRTLSARLAQHFILPARKIGKEITCHVCFSLGIRLPIGLREFYIDVLFDRAAKKYMAESYDGFVVLFKPFEDPVDVASWQTLVGEGLKIHHVPGTHIDVLNNRAHVKIWAERLMFYLRSPIVKGFAAGCCLTPDFQWVLSYAAVV